MTVEDTGNSRSIFLKIIWHDIGNSIEITNLSPLSNLLASIEEIKEETIVKIEIFYYFSTEKLFIPCAVITTKDGKRLYIDTISGKPIEKYRVLVGR